VIHTVKGFGIVNKAEVATLISDEVNFKIKTVRRDKQGQYTMIKASIQEVLT